MGIPRYILTSGGVLNYIPDVDLISVFTKRDEVTEKLRQSSVKIFYTGEDCEINYKSFSDYMINDVDLAIGFNYEEDMENYKNYVRYPYGLWRFFRIKLNKDAIKREVDLINSQVNNNAGDFAVMVNGHDRQGTRKTIIDIVEKLGHVSCGGKAYHNDDRLVNKFNNNKIEYLRQFMFCVCPENVSVKGYVTEKIYDAFAAGTIPIYYGGGGTPEPDVINQKAFLNFMGNNADELLFQIKELYENVSYYREFMKQPRLHEGAVDYIYERNKLLMEKLDEVLLAKSCGRRKPATFSF